jgi:hypothetical protein
VARNGEVFGLQLRLDARWGDNIPIHSGRSDAGRILSCELVYVDSPALALYPKPHSLPGRRRDSGQSAQLKPLRSAPRGTCRATRPGGRPRIGEAAGGSHELGFAHARRDDLGKSSETTASSVALVAHPAFAARVIRWPLLVKRHICKRKGMIPRDLL